MKLLPTLRTASILIGTLFLGSVFAQHEGAGHAEEAVVATGHGEAGDHGAEKFNAGKLIMEHIGDSHDWHLWGHTHLPLPIILKTPGGFEFFSSSRFVGEHHHPVSYTGTFGTYALRDKKIVAVDAAGNVDEAATAGVWDFSITKNVATLLFCVTLMLVIFIGMARGYAKRGTSAPKGLASFLEPVILFVRDDIAKSAIGEKHYKRFVPYLLTLFFFIWFLNLIGLIPIFPFGANVTGNIVTPLVLATITFLIVSFVANWHYWRHMLAMPGIPIPVLIILTPIEIMGHFIRPIVLMIRLFANIMAGHIVLLVFFCLIFIFSKNGESPVGGYATSPFAIAFTIFINCLELLVGALQAYVFTLLTSIYIGTAVAGGHDDHH
ncbi:MAG: F0F1 ATP synthase subunit A [Flavobacteriales bacterium]|nr:F0F1 ATP synthase subunit A [Flavobacteriales bacterium]